MKDKIKICFAVVDNATGLIFKNYKTTVVYKGRTVIMAMIVTSHKDKSCADEWKYFEIEGNEVRNIHSLNNIINTDEGRKELRKLIKVIDMEEEHVE